MKKFLYSVIGVGISLSAVAAFYSIGGLVKIFKGSATSIIILASALEAAKVLISVYLHVYWDRARKLLVGYLTFALVILAFITSLGIFGALSSAYFNSTDTEQLQTKISIIQSQIEIEQSKIRNGMSQISAIASIPKEEKQSWHFFKINTLSKEIDEYTKEIDKLNESLMPLKAELNRINMEVGPLKFLASWIYGETESATDKAVQLFIVMMVTVFDPLALLLIFAGIHGFEIEKETKAEESENIKKIKEFLSPNITNEEQIFKDIQEIKNADDEDWEWESAPQETHKKEEPLEDLEPHFSLEEKKENERIFNISIERLKELLVEKKSNIDIDTKNIKNAFDSVISEIETEKNQNENIKSVLDSVINKIEKETLQPTEEIVEVEESSEEELPYLPEANDEATLKAEAFVEDEKPAYAQILDQVIQEIEKGEPEIKIDDTIQYDPKNKPENMTYLFNWPGGDEDIDKMYGEVPMKNGEFHDDI